MQNLSDGGHHIIKCSACNKPLCDIWVIRPHVDISFKYRATCPYCNDKSFLKEIKGGITYGGIAEADPNSETIDDKRTLTVVEDVEWGGEIVEFKVKKVN